MVFFKKKAALIQQDSLDLACKHIDDQWKVLTRTNTRDSGTLIGLPNPYIVPSQGAQGFVFEEQYYWDSYFTALGLLEPEQQPIVEGMLDNLIYLFERFGMIPNASRVYFLSRSQPPLLTSYIMLVYERYNKSLTWLKEKMAVAEAEYTNVWMNDKHPYWHLTTTGLSRYYDINVLHDLAEAESGWDMTTRFDRKCLDFLPIDLNCYLYKYEADFALLAQLIGDKDGLKKWEKRMSARRDTINKLMWNSREKFYFDYNFSKGKRGNVQSLAGFTAMWSGMAEPERAAVMIKQIKSFENQGGLSTTTRPLIDMSMFGSLRAQWAYPNGWAPLHYFVIEGLEKYGYRDEAKRLARKWLETNLTWFEKHGEFQEKYNVVNPKTKPVEGVYPSQQGFGWTNGIFVYLSDRYL